MSHMKVAEARARFGELLDQAEQGHEVVIDRKGVRFRIVAEAAKASSQPRPALFDFVDPAVMDAQWTWKAGKTGAVFAARRKRR